MAFSRTVFTWLLDVFIVLFVAFITLASYFGLVPIDKQGFYCNDESLTFTFRGDSISLFNLLAISLIVPVIFILMVEFWRHRLLDRHFRHSCSSSSSSSDTPILANGTICHVYWRCCTSIYGTYFFGLTCCGGLVEFLKVAVGELRPHFIDTCRPDFTRINCSEGYITNYTCTGTVPVYRLMDAYKSFPSGHAALAIYMSLFLCFYVHKQIFPSPTYLSSSMLQTGLLFWAIYCSMSRIVDRRHHWWDVMAGFLIGTVCASYSALTWLSTNPPKCRGSLSLKTSYETKTTQSTGNHRYGTNSSKETNSRSNVSSQLSQQQSTVIYDVQTDTDHELVNCLGRYQGRQRQS